MSEIQSTKAGKKAEGRVKIGIWEHFAAVMLGGVIVFGVLAIAGTLNSGYHFMDDHELIRMEYGFRAGGLSLWDAVWAWLKNDLWWRFRPMYWVERVSLAYLFGSNLLYWNIYTAIQGILTCYLLYFSARYTGNGKIVSVLFPTVIILGPPVYTVVSERKPGKHGSAALRLDSLADCTAALYRERTKNPTECADGCGSDGLRFEQGKLHPVYAGFCHAENLAGVL